MCKIIKYKIAAALMPPKKQALPLNCPFFTEKNGTFLS